MAVVTVEKALQLWDEALQIQVHKTETIAVKAAKGYVLAEDVMALTDVPAFPKSAMMAMPLPTKKVVMNISSTVLLVLALCGSTLLNLVMLCVL